MVAVFTFFYEGEYRSTIRRPDDNSRAVLAGMFFGGILLLGWSLFVVNAIPIPTLIFLGVGIATGTYFSMLRRAERKLRFA